MAVGVHDARDYAFAKHFNFPIIEVVEGGDLSKESYDAKEGKLVNSDFLNGLEVKDAIKKAIEKIGALYSHQEWRGFSPATPIEHCVYYLTRNIDEILKSN